MSRARSDVVQRLIEEAVAQQGFVQHSPIRSDVWARYLDQPGEPVDLLLLPHRKTTAGRLAVAVNEALKGQLASPPPGQDWCDEEWQRREKGCVFNQSVAACTLRFETLVRCVLPLTPWWRTDVEPGIAEVLRLAERLADAKRQTAKLKRTITDLDAPRASGRTSGFSPATLWWIRMFGVVESVQQDHGNWPDPGTQLSLAAKLLRPRVESRFEKGEEPLFGITCNRPAEACLENSVRTVKADAARELFDVRCSGISWAVIDSGIDKRHPAFADAKGASRIVDAYDFTKLGDMLTLASSPHQPDLDQVELEYGVSPEQVRAMARNVADGNDVDWVLFADCLRVTPEREEEYLNSLDSHGTQVAGILGAAPLDADDSSPGVCPDIQLRDLRVLARRTGDTNSEFNIVSALQFVRYLNRDKDKPLVHGVNLSLSLNHSVKDYACGATPVCEECDRLVASGVVTVAAAGNFGFDRTDQLGSAMPGAYGDITITDPGNADSVVTVGATHGKYPHRYGVSYFSSRGPTGDGRPKPDVVAPGEGIVTPSGRDGFEEAHGTSIAAPHVSGAAALLMARHPGMIGEPVRIKQVLCESATDLRRNRDFQGHGLVDVLRALQSV